MKHINYRYIGEYEPTMTLSDYIEAFFEEENINAKLRYAEYDAETNRTEIGWDENGEPCSTTIKGYNHSAESAFELWKADRETQLDYIYSV